MVRTKEKTTRQNRVKRMGIDEIRRRWITILNRVDTSTSLGRQDLCTEGAEGGEGPKDAWSVEGTTTKSG